MDSPVVVALLIALGVAVIAMLGIAIFLLVKLLRMGRLVRADLMPVQGKVAFWAAIAYSIFPVDVLPDPIYLDDVGVLVGVITYIGHLAKKHGLLGARPTEPELEGPTGKTR
ncbi:YkvA family protein [Plantactinospora soyae]|uniref:Uncharacterized membrane protein YkvA (DUF1232 family) n=1 Tax=Plantactinospora soyae TaxID=1544732 RepID=A0A927ME00_9ACTN|nr:DUF1232 domain-containing protein [Plantactinospora soyae]MBE1491915.1 uncharacterized membrane protein YkvA (DUF1232 family) [Plantactinospora soyae]